MFPAAGPRDLLALCAAWGGMPRYWELAEPFGADVDTAIDALVLDPAGPLHGEPDRLLLEEVPPAPALRPLLDVIGAGAHRVSEIAGRLGRPASALARPLGALVEMGLVRRETPFGSDPRSGKRSLYRIDDPFLRLWFRVVAPGRTALLQAPRETRLQYWRRHRAALEAQAWEELCRLAVPFLHRSDSALGRLGPWEPAQRHWRRNEPECDVVARSVDGRRLLIGEAKAASRPRAATSPRSPPGAPKLPGAAGIEVVPALFAPWAPPRRAARGSWTRARSSACCADCADQFAGGNPSRAVSVVNRRRRRSPGPDALPLAADG